jgi:hypothetical protein
MVAKFGPLVKRQIEYWLWQESYFPSNHPRYRPEKAARYRKLVEDFLPLLDHLNAEEGTDLAPEPRQPRVRSAMRPAPDFQRQATEPAPTTAPTRPTAPPVKSDLADLPAELLLELSGGALAEVDPLIKIINDRGGTATLDEILIDLYRKYGEIGKRTLIGNKLYRLGRRELVWSLPGRKGIYTTNKPVDVATDSGPPPSSENDEGSDAGTSEPSSNTPETSAAPSSAAPSKVRRDLFASTAIPPTNAPLSIGRRPVM